MKRALAEPNIVPVMTLSRFVLSAIQISSK